MTHTPGPWHIKSHQSDGFIICDSNETIIAAVYGYTDHAGNTANARLIAAAPALLEACQVALTEYTSGGGYAPTAIEQLQAAIALAIGEKP